MNKNLRGFTLIELLVAISIIAILSVVGFSAFQNVQQKAKEARMRADVDAITKAYEKNFDPTLNGGQGGYRVLTGADFANGKIPTPDGTTATSYIIASTANPDGSLPSFGSCANLDTGVFCLSPADRCYCKSSTQGTAFAWSSAAAPAAPAAAPTPTPTPIAGATCVKFKNLSVGQSQWCDVSGETPNIVYVRCQDLPSGSVVDCSRSYCAWAGARGAITYYSSLTSDRSAGLMYLYTAACMIPNKQVILRGP